MSPELGPFFYIDDRLIYNACPLNKARKQAEKLDNSYGHEKLYEENFKEGDYIDYPRGRVVWDLKNNRAIVYIDPCINTPEILMKIAGAFKLTDYVTEGDDHYHCRNCIGDIWN